MNQSADTTINDFVVVIPARYGSTRFPGKLLMKIDDRPMILWVLRLAQRSGATRVVVATDHPQIAEVVTAAGGEICMTAADHPSGTARLAEVVEKMNWSAQTIVVNLQGDEPLLPPIVIRQLVQRLNQNQTEVATLAAPLQNWDEFIDPNVVKVVTDQQENALYFSRAPIPWDRQRFTREIGAEQGSKVLANPLFQPYYQRHIGLYAYRATFIRRYQQWPISPLEQIELLEQLRILWQGEKIQVVTTSLSIAPGVDTPADLRRVRQVFFRSSLM